jgi:hypothetical protein
MIRDEIERCAKKLAKDKHLPPEREWVTFMDCLSEPYDLGLNQSVEPKEQWDAEKREGVLVFLAERHLKAILSDLRRCDEKFQDHTLCCGPKTDSLK